MDVASAAPLVTILENAYVHILYVGPSSAPEVTRLAGDRLTRSGMGSLELDLEREPRALPASNDDTAPLRPKASPRSSPSHSVRSNFSFRVASEETESATTSSEDGSPIRGRTLLRTSAHERPEPRAMTRLQTGPLFGDLDTGTMRQRLLSRDLCVEPDDIDGCYMEPLPFERFRSSLSEELHKAATSNGSIDLTNFGGHRDTFAVLGLRRTQIQGPDLPVTFFQRLLVYVGFEGYLAIRLSCRCWSDAITRARPVVMPSVYNIPAEILESVYGCLSPVDLNAARHTCRAWMIGSLEERLLTRALKEGGWWAAAKADMDLHEDLQGQRTPDSINKEWLLSKRLATECSLCPDWTGDGLSKTLSSSDTGSNHAGIALTSEIDFSELSTGYHPSRIGKSQQGSAVHFTVSVCGRYLLVAEGCLIYVYSLRDSTSISHRYGGHLSLVTTVICPHRVLAVTMDTSSQRFAVAALLEGRVGLVCDLHEYTPSSSQKRSTPHVSSNTTRNSVASFASSVSSGEPLVNEATSHNEYATLRGTPNDRASARAIAEASLPEAHPAREVRTSWRTFWRTDGYLATSETEPAGGSSTRTGDSPPKTHKRPIVPSTNIDYRPLETGIRSIYRNLCSAEDPPRSVAICPQRRCVAFGCAAGIELHWIDAVTGQDLNRWFPLTAPSDFLYFIPPRPGVDSAKKLRLISSACHPKEKEGLGGRFFPSTSTNVAGPQSMTWDQGLPDPNAWVYAWRGGWCDHYRAVPISDGWNILFTDPDGGSLCLGTDAPPGLGATKLTRRFVFKGPSESGENLVPRIYAAGRELRWGVRVAVAYGEAIWLFVVPPDVFFAYQQKTLERRPDGQDADALDEPVMIEGVQIGHMEGLVDLAVDALGGDLTIRSFAVDGMAYGWQIAGCRQRLVKRIVLGDGTVMAAEDADGDTFMFNTSEAAVHFDGAAPVRSSQTVACARRHPCLQPSVHDCCLGYQDRVIDHRATQSNLDKDGDTVMRDADAESETETEEDEGYVSGAGEDEMGQAGGVFAIHVPPLWGRWSGEDEDWVPDYLARRGVGIEDDGMGVDVLGMMRVEVEILCG